MTTIENKIAKNGSVLYYVNGKRVARLKALEAAVNARDEKTFSIEYLDYDGQAGGIVSKTGAFMPTDIKVQTESHAHEIIYRVTANWVGLKGFCAYKDDAAEIKAAKNKANALLNAIALAYIDGARAIAITTSDEIEIIPDNPPPETDGSEDDPGENAFDLPYDLDGLNDVDSEPVAHVTFHDTDIKFLPGGQEIQRIRINREQILIVNGETYYITSKKYNASYDTFEKAFYLATPLYPNRRKLTTEENFWAAMAERGACSFDTPKDKTALADSLTRAMTIALVNYQTFYRAKNLTGAERELKLYNICRKALSELWRSEAA